MFNFQLNSAKVTLVSIWLLLLVVGCQPTVSENIKTVVATETISNEQTAALPSATTITPTYPISQSVTLTWTPIPSPTNSPTPEPKPTLLPTETAVPTPWPTLSPDEAAEKVLSLLADNQNPDCLLPCWWGAMPGQTQWWDIQPYLQSFSLQIYPYPQDSLYVMAFPVPSSVSYLEELHIGYILNTSDIITSIDIPSLNIEGYDAKTMVTLYGVPDEVWLTTLDEPREGVLPFQLIIVYQQQGISFHYYVDATRTGETVTACFEPGMVELERPDLFPAGPRIYLWEPGQTETIQEISPVPLERYFRLETKTDLTPETFYEKFTDPNARPCIDTLAALWKY